jgi:hypothetical protein
MQLAVISVIIALLSLVSYYQRQLVEIDRRENLHRVVRGWDGLAWYVWLLAAPATMVMVRRIRIVRQRLVRSLSAMFFGSVAILLGITNLRYGLRVLTNHWRPGTVHQPSTWANYVHTQSVLLPIDLLTYCGIFAAAFALDYYFKYRRRTDEMMRLQLKAACLQSELAQAQLTLLRGQLHPHFLFNAFNAISTLVRQERNGAAVEMIARLGELLRITMENIDHPELPLGRELEFVRSYLDIERVRFGDKLRTEIRADPSLHGSMVPSLLLQPLVENAIKHGISRRVTPGWVRLAAERSDDRLVISVVDDGPEEDGVVPAVGNASGLGLRNTRSRLDQIYGKGYRMDIGRRPEGGTRVTVDLPWRSPYRPAAQPVRAPEREAVPA